VTDHVLVFAGGDPLPPRALAGLPPTALVVAADSGAVHALAAGRRVDVLVGDLDSVPPDVLERVVAEGGRVERHPTAKDQTDLALALDVAVAQRPAVGVTVVGGHGGRLDHLLANLLLLAAPAYATTPIDAVLGLARAVVVRGRRTFTGRPRDLVTLVPVGGPARGVSTERLLFPLMDAVLEPGTSWGVSNQLLGEDAAVRVGEGVVLAVLPGELGPLAPPTG
jgi:thiamine pyrophosphokinase